MFAQSRGVKRGREQDNDPLLDRHGNSATPKLFVNKLPHNITEREVSELFAKYDGFTDVQLGNKVLMLGEFRTCVVTFGTAEQAAAARVGLQHLQSPGWSNPMLINFVKQDVRDSQQYLTTAPTDDSSLERDALGNYACATIFVKNFAQEIGQDKMATLFPGAIKIMPGNKQLRPGEFRTCYITYEDTSEAIAARKAVNGYTDEAQVVPLIIYYSVRPQDQTKPTRFAPPTTTTTAGNTVGFPSAMGLTPASFSNSPMYQGVPSPHGHGSHGSHSHGSHGHGHGHSHGSHGHGSHPPFPTSPYTSNPLAALNPYSALPALYAAGYSPSAGYPDPFGRMNPFHGRMGAAPPAEDARYSLSDLFDAKGNAASSGLFIDCLPYDIRENQIHAIFSHSIGFKGLHMGNKALAPTEYRTAIVHFNSTENALRARSKLQYYREPGWTRPLIIHYAKH